MNVQAINAGRRRLLMALGAGAAFDTAAQFAPSVAAAPMAQVDNEMSRYWLARMAAFAAEAPPRGAVVFLGDSMTERFALDRYLPAAGGPYVNRGIGGDKVGGWRYRGLLDRIDTSVLALAPRQVVLMIGVNDIVFAGTPTALLDAATATLLQRLAAAAPLLVQAVLPARGPLAQHNAAITRFNTQLQALTAAVRANWLDLRGAFSDDQGALRSEYASDSLHLNETGYARWAEALAPRLLPAQR